LNKLEYYTPNDIPNEIQTYETQVKQLGVGKSGKVGILDLELQKDSTGNGYEAVPAIRRQCASSVDGISLSSAQN